MSTDINGTEHQNTGQERKVIERVKSFSAAIGKKIGDLLGFGNTPEGFGIILPERVRYALRYKNARFDRDDVLSLLEPQFGLLGFYLVAKAIEESQPLKYRQLIRDVSQIILQNEDTQTRREDIAKLCRHYLEEVADEDFGEEGEFGRTILGTKSAQISRMGFGEMEIRVNEVISELPKRGETMLMANACLIGLEAFVERIRGEKASQFLIYNPKKVSTSAESRCLRVYLQDSKMHVEEIDITSLDTSKEIYAVDDTRNTGSTGDKIITFLKKIGYQRPIYIAGSLPNGPHPL